MNFTKTKVNIEKWLFQDKPDPVIIAVEWDQYAAKWDKWAIKAQKNKIRWFFIETLPGFSYRFVWAYERTVRQLKYKYIWKCNLIKIHSLKATEWYGVDDRLMHGMFQLLVDLVEFDKANSQIVWSEDDVPRYMMKANYRNPEMGIKRLNWEISLSEEEGGLNQAKNAKKIKALYIWWTITRVNRTELIDIKGSTGFSTNEYYGDMRSNKSKDFAVTCHEIASNKGDKDQELYESVNKAYDDAKVEYEKEDDKMLLQLVKLRRHLWTP